VSNGYFAGKRPTLLCAQVGKTTTIKTLMGLLRSDSGTAEVFGIPVTDADRSSAIRCRIGFVTEDEELYPYMTVEQLIRFTRPFFPK